LRNVLDALDVLRVMLNPNTQVMKAIVNRL